MDSLGNFVRGVTTSYAANAAGRAMTLCISFLGATILYAGLCLMSFGAVALATIILILTLPRSAYLLFRRLARSNMTNLAGRDIGGR
jgi:hypothetical protein